VFIAAGVALAPFTSFPVGAAKVNPTQAFLNVLAAVTIGPLWGGFMAYAVGQARLVLGLGTVFAFPGGVIGAVLAGVTWKVTGNLVLTALAEVLGTGLLAPAVGGWLLAPLVQSKATFWALAPGFSLSTVAGAALALAVVGILKKAGVPGLELKR
jgi:energy-coupling factor transport system ATP-binding protein